MKAVISVVTVLCAVVQADQVHISEVESAEPDAFALLSLKVGGATHRRDKRQPVSDSDSGSQGSFKKVAEQCEVPIRFPDLPFDQVCAALGGVESGCKSSRAKSGKCTLIFKGDKKDKELDAAAACRVLCADTPGCIGGGVVDGMCTRTTEYRISLKEANLQTCSAKCNEERLCSGFDFDEGDQSCLFHEHIDVTMSASEYASGEGSSGCYVRGEVGTQLMVPQPNLLQKTDLGAAASWVNVQKSYSIGPISARMNLQFHLSQCELHLSGNCVMEAYVPGYGSVAYDPCAEYLPPTTLSDWAGAALFWARVDCPDGWCSAMLRMYVYGACSSPTQIAMTVQPTFYALGEQSETSVYSWSGSLSR